MNISLIRRVFPCCWFSTCCFTVFLLFVSSQKENLIKQTNFSLSPIFPAWPSCFRVLGISICILLCNPDCILEVHCSWWTTRETQVVLWQPHSWVLASSFYGLLGASKQFYHVEPAVSRNPGAKFPTGLRILCHTCVSQGRPGLILQVGSEAFGLTLLFSWDSSVCSIF